MAALAAAPSVQAQSGIDYKFSGFGTLGVVHSDNRGADYVTTRLQPNGAGLTRQTDFGPDSKLGGQLSVNFNDNLSAVVQVVAQHQGNNSFNPDLEWANVKYKFNDSVSVRLGRIALPPYLISESRQVGYSYTWVHPPVEVYSVLPITSNDGVDISWKTRIGEAHHVLQLYYGTKSSEVGSTKIKSNPAAGFTSTLEYGALTAHLGYMDAKIGFKSDSIEPLFVGLRQFAAAAGAVPVPGFQTASAYALAMAEKYRTESRKQTALSLGVSYDPGEWLVMGEFVRGKGEGLIGTTTAWHLLGGYRFGQFTPYVGVASAKVKYQLDPGIPTAAAPPLAAGAAALSAGINTVIQSINPEQKSKTVGVRWDAIRNVAFKLQYERSETGKNSTGYYAQPVRGWTGSKVNLVSAAADFVF